MITITPEAAAQIRKASELSEAEDMYLRLAARRETDGSIEYGMGFDDMSAQDQLYTSQGIDVLIADSLIYRHELRRRRFWAKRRKTKIRYA